MDIDLGKPAYIDLEARKQSIKPKITHRKAALPDVEGHGSRYDASAVSQAVLRICGEGRPI